ncbi:MAG TPA: hypothetical protein VHO02_03935 [Fibrobacteria bacterium]|nr:hypothetical protein [Fibrobacteria bacterium]
MTRRFSDRLKEPHVLVGIAVFAFTLLFALYTRHAWEDWYITFRPAKNLATGHGLVYNEGERVHTFTSVIGTLLPALLSFLTFNVSDDLTLWLFRICCAAALGVSAGLLARLSRKWFAGLVPAVLLVGGLGLDAKAVDFSINGMETPFTLLALSLFLHFVTVHSPRDLGVRLGVVWALLQYTRPDGFLYALLLMAGMFFFLPERKELPRALAISCATGALLFAPWFLFATWYYGSAVPHSLVAKRVWTEHEGITYYFDHAVSFVRSLLLFQSSAADAVFTPPYAPNFRSLPPALIVSRILGTFAACVWISPKVPAAGRMASFAFLGYLSYLAIFTPLIYPWYVPGATLLALVSLAFAVDAAVRSPAFQAQSSFLRNFPKAFTAFILLYALFQTAVSADQFRFAQKAIEDGQRRRIGEWLKANSASPRETVFLECAGYIGFYSGLKLYDYPGMTSPETVAARRTLNSEDFLPLVRRLRPDWLVLRPEEGELAGMWQRDSMFLKENYRVMMTFDATAAIREKSFKPFGRYFTHDSRFVVVRRIL